MSDANAPKTYAEAMQHNTQQAAIKNKVLAAEIKSYKSNISSVSTILRNGKRIIFVGGKYRTNLPSEIEELDNEILHGHPNITEDDEPVPEVFKVEPIEALRARIIAEYVETTNRTLNKANDAGTSDQGKLNVANSSTVGEGAAGSDSSMGTVAAVATKVSVATK